jgi:hypothetical protein
VGVEGAQRLGSPDADASVVVLAERVDRLGMVCASEDVDHGAVARDSETGSAIPPSHPCFCHSSATGGVAEEWQKHGVLLGCVAVILAVTAAGADLTAPPTGDGNNTAAFVCRAMRKGASWSEHAYGRAIDVNPFQNPYRRDDLVLPELASAYLDRGNVRPGMVLDVGVVVEAFEEIGWSWGGEWSSPDLMHFSEAGR